MTKDLKAKPIFFLYARKSSENEDRQIQSIDDQINRLKELASRSGFLVKDILEESKSAKKPYNRPIFTRMLERIKEGEANGILCWHLNRLTRNPVDSGEIGWMLQEGKIQCIQTIDRQYLPEDNVLLFSLETAEANQFIINLRKVSWRGMEGKSERGWMPSRAPLGYQNDLLQHVIIEDPERFNLVRQMWTLLLTGNYTPTQVLKIANEQWGLRTPKRKRGGGSELSRSVVYKLFTNIFYTGMFKWAGGLYKGNHTPMITLEEYDRAQALMGRKGRPRAQNHDFSFTGMIRCGDCSCMFTATEKKKLVRGTGELKNYTYYHCTKKNRGKKCFQKSLTLVELEDQIREELNKYTIRPEFKDWALEILKEENEKEILDRSNIYEMQQRSLSETQRELDNLTRMRYKELIDDKTFIVERDDLRNKISKLRGQIGETYSRTENWEEIGEKVFEFARDAYKSFLTGDIRKKKEIFAALGSNYIVLNKKLTIQPNEWLKPIAEKYPSLEDELNRLELDKNLTEIGRNEAKTSIRLHWGG